MNNNNPIHARPRRSAPGFTLIELLVAIAVMAVLVAVAIPSFRTLIMDNRRAGAVNDVLSSLQRARSEAGKHGRAVIVCGITGTDNNCAGGPTWDYGWIVFVDTNDNKALDAGEQLQLTVNDKRGVTIRSNLDLFLFRPFSQSSTNGTIAVCDTRGAGHGRAILVGSNGRARVATPEQDPSLTCTP